MARGLIKGGYGAGSKQAYTGRAQFTAKTVYKGALKAGATQRQAFNAANKAAGGGSEGG